MISQAETSETIVFYDPTYPQACSAELLEQLLPSPYDLADAAGLSERLTGCKLLVSFHGAYFPKASWQALIRFLEEGGNIAFFGGMPFTRPVNEEGLAEPEQDAYTREIYLGPFFTLPISGSGLHLVADEKATFLSTCTLSIDEETAGTFWASYPKLTQVSDHPEDIGSAGPIDTILKPLIFACTTTDHGTRRIATPALALDQRSGRFRGGRWLISAWQPSSEEGWLANRDALQQLILFAAEGATTCEIRPALACYQPGEAPSLIVTVRTCDELQAHIVVRGADGATIMQEFDLEFAGSPIQQEQRLQLAVLEQPGLYQIEMEFQQTDGLIYAQESGFWLWDEALVTATRGKRLRAGRDYLYQGENIFLVYGTTYMDSGVQRKFLYLPNPARWNADMREMKATGINLLRTGLWTAWREFTPIAGMANEAFLRALDAFVMTICRHELQLIFTFFSFYPPLFEGENPWLDPRSVTAQQDFLALLATRYAKVELLSWDLINEPSFGDPKRAFASRPLPHYDRYEVKAFQKWLAERSTLSDLQLRWRQTPSTLPNWDAVRPPAFEDYETNVRTTTTRYMLQVADYTHFSQEMFNVWASHMYEALRAGGSQTLIGVGQDEAGARISPQYYASALDYTTTHPWWNIDDMLWDILMDKTPGKPSLTQETGVMLARDLDGRPWRNEEQNANLLGRKLIMGLIARSAGLIQWLWHTNAYMTSDNENSIGLLRSDGSAKPELAVMEHFGRLVQALSGRLIEASTPPDIWLVIPYSQWFARPELARAATQRAVRTLGYSLGIIPQLVGEHQLAALTNGTQHPRLIILPALQLFDTQAWHILRSYMQSGGTVLASGVLARDRYNLPFDPAIAGLDSELATAPVSLYETLSDGVGKHYYISYSEEKIGYVKKAHNELRSYGCGEGRLVWCGLPLELANEQQVMAEIYRQVLGEQEYKENITYLLARQPLRDGTLILIVSESGQTQKVEFAEGLSVTVEANQGGAVIIENDGHIRTFGGIHT